MEEAVNTNTLRWIYKAEEAEEEQNTEPQMPP